jgi:hypothetical protein
MFDYMLCSDWHKGEASGIASGGVKCELHTLVSPMWKFCVNKDCNGGLVLSPVIP